MRKIPHREILVADTLRIFFKAIMKYRARAILSLVLPIGMILLAVAVPYFAGRVLAGIIQHSPSLNANLLGLGIASVLGVLGNRIGFTTFMAVQARTMADLHHTVFERLLQRSVGFHANNISGKLISDAMEFVAAFGTFVNAAYVNGLSFMGSIIIGLIVVWFSAWQLGLYLTVVVVVIMLWAWSDSRHRAGLRTRRLVATKALTAHLSDTIVNAQTVKTFSQETEEIKRNNTLNLKLQGLRIHDWQHAGYSASNRMAVLLGLQLCMVVLIIHLSRANPATLAAGIFAFTYTLTLSNRLFEINTLTRQIDEALLQASPMTAMLQEPLEIQNHKHATKLTVSKGVIDLDDVSFAYTEDARDSGVFQGLTLHVKPGERIGVVGPSGGGKSTLTRLLLRFDDIQQGTIKIDGQDIASVTQGSLRRAIAYVPQEPLLFHRTIRENIAYGKTDTPTEDIIEAAKKANAHDFISALPDGYDTVVGERGVKLSGGQRQRVAIARAILKDAPILVLDEATSALDSESEVLIQDALWKLMKGRTAIVIAHRLSTIQKMDRIIVLNDGTIAEEGTHKQLQANKKGLYSKLWSHQSGGFIEE